MKELKEYEVIQEKRFGRIRIFRIDDDDLAGYKIKQFLKTWLTTTEDQNLFILNNIK